MGSRGKENLSLDDGPALWLVGLWRRFRAVIGRIVTPGSGGDERETPQPLLSPGGCGFRCRGSELRRRGCQRRDWTRFEALPSFSSPLSSFPRSRWPRGLRTFSLSLSEASLSLFRDLHTIFQGNFFSFPLSLSFSLKTCLTLETPPSNVALVLLLFFSSTRPSPFVCASYLSPFIQKENSLTYMILRSKTYSAHS